MGTDGNERKRTWSLYFTKAQMYPIWNKSASRIIPYKMPSSELLCHKLSAGSGCVVLIPS